MEMVNKCALRKKKREIFNKTCFRYCKDGGERVVLLQLEGQEIPNRVEDKPGNRSRVLESHWQRQGSLQCFKWSPTWDEEDPCFLQGQSPTWREDQVGHARVPPGR